ncbi:MAG: hypothetical protein ABT11_13235 [Novosphingobium sp. SCN 66-18]|nr:MAG: hypothetical protein ABT11_13235 [Novosphingobium sp. SCN 66-18]
MHVAGAGRSHSPTTAGNARDRWLFALCLQYSCRCADAGFPSIMGLDEDERSATVSRYVKSIRSV